jgi:hypothetical protein
MNITSISDEIYRELSLPDDISISTIAFWLRSNVGDLNTLIGCDFSVDPATLEFDGDLNESQWGIFKQLYILRYYDKKIRDNLGASAYETSSITDEDSSVKFVTRTDKAKLYMSLRKDAYEQFNKLVAAYSLDLATPLEVTADGIAVPQPDSSYSSYPSRRWY